MCSLQICLFSGSEVKVKGTTYFDLEIFFRSIFMKFGTQILVDVLSTNMLLFFEFEVKVKVTTKVTA